MFFTQALELGNEKKGEPSYDYGYFDRVCI